MPNYVKNILTITATKEQLDNLLNEVKSEDSCFDFNKIIPMPKSLDIESGSRTQLSYDYHSYKRNKELLPVLESYFKKYQQEIKDNDFEKFLEYLLKEKIVDEKYAKTVYENKEKYGHTDWYSWSIANWGTKWNAIEPTIQDNIIEFDTAWSSPLPIIEKLAAKFPQVKITHKWADEDIGSNVGMMVYEYGEVSEEDDIIEHTSDAYMIYQECWGDSECIAVDENGRYYRKSCSQCDYCK